MPRIVFIESNGARRDCTYEAGETVLTVARRYGVGIEGACSGAMACSTCHVYVDDAWRSRLPKAGREENAMLDLACGATKASRLGCQIVLDGALDGLTVRVA